MTDPAVTVTATHVSTVKRTIELPPDLGLVLRGRWGRRQFRATDLTEKVQLRWPTITMDTALFYEAQLTGPVQTSKGNDHATQRDGNQWTAYADGGPLTVDLPPEVAPYALGYDALRATLHGVNPLMGYSPDAEDCEACTLLDDACPYHRGAATGVEWMARKLALIADNPDALHAITTPPATRRPHLPCTCATCMTPAEFDA